MTMNEGRPPRIQPRVKSAPRIKQIYWCDYPKDAHLPEFWKTRPVIVISRKAKLFGVVTVIPMTTQEQETDQFSVKLSNTWNNELSWAICNHPTTVAVSRLSPPGRTIPTVPQDDFDRIVAKIWANLPSPVER